MTEYVECNEYCIHKAARMSHHRISYYEEKNPNAAAASEEGGGYATAELYSQHTTPKKHYPIMMHEFHEIIGAYGKYLIDEGIDPEVIPARLIEFAFVLGRTYEELQVIYLKQTDNLAF